MARSWAQLLGEADAAPEPEADRAGMFSRLRDSLSKSRRALTGELASAAFDPGNAADWERLEEALIMGDVGVRATAELVQRLEARGELGDLNAALADEVAALFGEPGTLAVRERPSVILVVGVNGTGKTTTIGKLASKLHAHGLSVVVAAADTFRAAAEEQLEIWAERAGADFVGSERGGDPAAVAYDAIEAAQARGRDVVIVDTAGRLHTQTNLMEELAKVRRVIEGKLPGAPHETLLVVDATTGQNGVQQAKLFGETAGVTGVALTKLDGSAKGGVAIPIAFELGLPVKLMGVGEQLDDLRPFDAHDFARALVSSVALGATAEPATERDGCEAALRRGLPDGAVDTPRVGGHVDPVRAEQAEARERRRQLGARMHLVGVLPEADDLLHGSGGRDRAHPRGEGARLLLLVGDHRVAVTPPDLERNAASRDRRQLRSGAPVRVRPRSLDGRAAELDPRSCG
jgi:fused signal recognition particle receptor